MRRLVPAALLLLAAGVAPALASPLGLSWGAVSEPAVEGTMPPGRVAEHLEFLQSTSSSCNRMTGGRSVFASWPVTDCPPGPC
jgi:hypothetical protein